MTSYLRDMSAVLFVIFIVSAIFDIREASSCCPDGWISYKHSCYLFADEDKIDWNEAVTFCRIRKSQLVTVDTENESRFIKYFARKLFKQDSPQRYRTIFWTGASDSDIEGIWKWIATDTELKYTEWSPGQPNLTPDNKEDCLALNGAYDFNWHDGVCKERVGYPLCEINLPGGDSNSGMAIIG